MRRALQTVYTRIFGGPPTLYWIEENTPHEPRQSHERCHWNQTRAQCAHLPSHKTQTSSACDGGQVRKKCNKQTVQYIQQNSRDVRKRAEAPKTTKMTSLRAPGGIQKHPNTNLQVAPQNLPCAGVCWLNWMHQVTSQNLPVARVKGFKRKGSI